MDNEFGIWLKNMRRRNLLSQLELANKAGIERVTITLLETGKSNPSISTLNKLAKVFNLDPSELKKFL